MVKRCDNRSVGVLIRDRVGRLLMFERVTPPVGVAPPAGHVDDHGGADDAARAEVAEEVGLTVTSLRPVLVRWQPNVCRRLPGPDGVGHTWTVYEAQAAGAVAAAPREARRPRWLAAGEVQALADRTVLFARGGMSADVFAAEPGLEPAWVGLLAELGVVDVPAAGLDAVAGVAAGVRR